MTINCHHNIIEPGCSIHTKYNQADKNNSNTQVIQLTSPPPSLQSSTEKQVINIHLLHVLRAQP